MSGIAIKMKFDDREVGEMLENLAMLGRGKLAPALKSIANTLHTAALDAFEKERSPEGQAWKKSKRAINESGQTLSDSGRLKDSLSVIANGSYAEVGTNAVYAAIHQFGGFAGRGRKVKMPARPFLPDPNNLAPDLRFDILETLEKQIKRAFR